ncbi:MAG: YbdK family carboxylate-amine ligase [Solirubrobacterales bacterium]|nr:YbdK family carboxylate-amine ligase [Solirubrobacterales bacterium]
MILDRESHGLAHGIEALLEAVPDGISGMVKPELMQSVLEIATDPCDGVAAAGRQLAELRRIVIAAAESRGMGIAAAATHPFARWDEQRITDRARYRELIDELGYLARRELIFGTHVHVGIVGPDRAIYVADGIRRYLPLFLALSTNSPFWQGERTGMKSSRVPIFRGFPREGVPPHYGTWEIYQHRVELMMRAGAIPDYTFLWWDVRAHPNLGTVETRVFDQQTRVEHTVSLAALNVCLAHRMCALYDAEEPLVEYPTELIDDNKVRAALRGTDGRLVDFRAGEQVPAPEMARDLIELLLPHADELGCRAELEGVEDLLEGGTGAHRQEAMYERSDDLPGLVAEIAAHTPP